ncbi:MAG TPA: hypothetical protein VL402_10275 [Xanthobacteraceae bacterium]|nr:hypothetical protein [Xanthobacteraceae bacterium]
MPIEKRETTSSETGRRETAETECLERLYRKIGISAVAAAMRYQGQEIAEGTQSAQPAQPAHVSGEGQNGGSARSVSRRKAHRAA